MHDGINTLDLVNRHTLLRIIKVHNASDVTGLLLVYHIGILLKHLIISSLCRLLQQMDRLRIVAVMLPGTSHLMPALAV